MDSTRIEKQRLLRRCVADDLAGSTYLVTGGCGFVGSRVVRYLSLCGATCIAIDNLYTGKLENIGELPNVEVIIDDVRNEDLLRSLLPECQRVVHCATVNIIAAQIDPQLDLLVNAAGTQLLASLCAEHSNIMSMLYTSSASVYGNATRLPTCEESPSDPLSYYAISKLAGEHYCRIENTNRGTPITILRLSNVFGPHQDPDNSYCGVVAKIYRALRREGLVSLYGSGEQTRDFTYVDDVAKAVVLASMNPEAHGKVFNVASGQETRINDLVHMMASVMDIELKFRQVAQRSIDNVDRRCLDVQKIRRVLGWEAKTTLLAGLRRTVVWLNEQEELTPAESRVYG